MLEGFTGSKHWILPIQGLRTGREQRVPESSNQSLFPENEGNFGGNQLPDGSSGLSPLRRRRTICPSISKRAFARDSPDFAFFRHISRVFPRVTLTSNHSQDHGQWQVCMCVCACVCDCECVCCVLCACGKTLKTTRNREKCSVEPTVTVMKADTHLQIYPSTVCVIDAKKCFRSSGTKVRREVIADGQHNNYG